jgi:hypothetical protein
MADGSAVNWSVYSTMLLSSALVVHLTTVRRAPRLLRALARNLFVLSFLLFLAQVAMVAGVALPRPLLSHSSRVPAPASGDSVVGGPSLSASFVNKVLSAAGSPAVGTGQALYDLSVRYRIDDAYALATFEHESTYGKYGAASVNHSLGNIICAGYATCNGRFRWYATWQEGYADFYRLIASQYVARGLTTIDRIIPVYAPATDNNDTVAYIAALRQAMRAYRAGVLG